MKDPEKVMKSYAKWLEKRMDTRLLEEDPSYYDPDDLLEEIKDAGSFEMSANKNGRYCDGS